MRIKELLKEKGITQKELAKRLQITPQTLSVLLKKPTFSTILRVAQVLNVETIKLYDSPEEWLKESTSAPPKEQAKDIAHNWKLEYIEDKFGSVEEYEACMEEDRKKKKKITIICPHCGKEIPLKIDTEALYGKG